MGRDYTQHGGMGSGRSHPAQFFEIVGIYKASSEPARLAVKARDEARARAWAERKGVAAVEVFALARRGVTGRPADDVPAVCPVPQPGLPQPILPTEPPPLPAAVERADGSIPPAAPPSEPADAPTNWRRAAQWAYAWNQLIGCMIVLSVIGALGSLRTAQGPVIVFAAVVIVVLLARIRRVLTSDPYQGGIGLVAYLGTVLALCVAMFVLGTKESHNPGSLVVAGIGAGQGIITLLLLPLSLPLLGRGSRRLSWLLKYLNASYGVPKCMKNADPTGRLVVSDNESWEVMKPFDILRNIAKRKLLLPPVIVLPPAAGPMPGTGGHRKVSLGSTASGSPRASSAPPKLSAAQQASNFVALLLIGLTLGGVILIVAIASKPVWPRSSRASGPTNNAIPISTDKAKPPGRPAAGPVDSSQEAPLNVPPVGDRQYNVSELPARLRAAIELERRGRGDLVPDETRRLLAEMRRRGLIRGEGANAPVRALPPGR